MFEEGRPVRWTSLFIVRYTFCVRVGRPALWPLCPFARPCTIRAIAPHTPGTPRGTAPQTKASLVKGRCRACEAEGFLPVCGCDSAQGIARRNPSVRLRRPPPFDKGGRTVEKGALTPWPPLRGGSARRRWGRELYGCPKYFGLWQGSLPPPLRGTSLAEGGFSAPDLKLHFKFHSCKIRQSVLQSHSIPF